MNTVKQYIDLVSKPLTYTCNKSLENGTFPKEMKIAKVIPLFKAGDKKLFSNYRPVSLLPQYGFREKRSTSGSIY